MKVYSFQSIKMISNHFPGVNQDTIAAFDSETDSWHTTKLLSYVNCNIGNKYTIFWLQAMYDKNILFISIRYSHL